LARRIGEGEADLRDELDGQGAPHGGDLAPAAPLLKFHQTDPGLPAPSANKGLCCSQPFRPDERSCLSRITGGQQALDKLTGAQDACVGQDALVALADGPDLGPAAQGAD
jgi:hypothetical protein